MGLAAATGLSYLALASACTGTSSGVDYATTTRATAPATNRTIGTAAVTSTTLAQAAPTGLHVAERRGDYVTLEWIPADGAVRYAVLLLGREFAEVEGLTYEFGTEVGGRYEVSVIAIGATGNRSEPSNTIVFSAPEEINP